MRSARLNNGKSQVPGLNMHLGQSDILYSCDMYAAEF